MNDDLSSMGEETLRALYARSKAAPAAEPAETDLASLSDDELRAMYSGGGAKAPAGRSWKDVPLEAAKNVPHSAYELGKNIIQPIIHPIDTAVAIKNLGKGVLQKTGVMSGDDAVPHADAVGQFLSDRYGGTEAIKNTLATDPVGTLADLSMLLTGGSAAAIRAPGLLGKTAEIAGAAGRAIDPISLAATGAKGVGTAVGRVGSEVIGGVGTHTGGQSLRTAAGAGYEGGEAARAFQDNLRGRTPLEEVVGDARGAVAQMKQDKNAAYRAGKDEFTQNTSPLNFDRVDDALADISAVKTFHGKILDPSTQQIRGEIGALVKDWKQSDPTLFHTVEGFDALKQAIGDVRDKTQFGTPERRVADQAYHAVGNTIKKESPEYAKTMSDYSAAKREVDELQRTLSLGEKASVDTALRKLQSVLRNNVHSNYGQRAKLAETLVENGAPQLMEKLAGQALNPMLPRGLGRLALTGGAEAALLHGAGLPAIAALPLMSPRLMGEAAYYGGRAAKGLTPGARIAGKGVRPAFQAGRLANEAQPDDWEITAPPRRLSAARTLLGQR